MRTMEVTLVVAPRCVEFVLFRVLLFVIFDCVYFHKSSSVERVCLL